MGNRLFAMGAVATAAAMLVACGGGGDDPIGGGTTVTPGQSVAIVSAPAPDISVLGGAVLNVTATAESYKTNLQSMNWTATAEAAGSPEIQLTNSGCEGAVKNDMKGTAGYSSSTWTCNASTMLPASNRDAVYNITVTGVDKEGFSSSASSRVRVAALPDSALVALRPSIATTPNVVLRGGQQAGLTCFGAAGASANKSLTYGWRIKSNPNGAAFTLTDTSSSTVRFTTPEAMGGSPIRAVFECAVTDSSGNSATADVNVTISADADLAPAPTAGAPGSVTLHTGVETLLSCVGTGGYRAEKSKPLAYQWVIKENSSGAQIELTGANQADVRIRPLSLLGSAPSAPVVLQCRVTDDANRTAVVDVQATIYRSDSSSNGTTVIANAGNTQRVAAGAVVTLNGTASQAVGGAAQIFYAWKQVSGAPVSISNANSASASFVAPTAGTGSTLRFSLTAAAQPISANYVPRATEEAYVDVVVGGVAEPRIFLPPVQAVTAGSPVTIFATVMDNPEAKPVYYRWTQVSGQPVQLQTPNLGGVSFFAPMGAGDVVLRVQASFMPAFPSAATASADAIVRVE